MSMLEDGRGSGRKAEVSPLFQLITQAISVPVVAFDTILGFVWTIPFEDIDPAGADDYFLYLRNDGTPDLLVSRLTVSSTVAGRLEIHKVTGTPSGGTDIDPVNRNLGATRLPSATTESGTDITGLTNAGIIGFTELVADTENDNNLGAEPIVLPRNTAIALLWSETTGVLTGNLTLVQRITTAE